MLRSQKRTYLSRLHGCLPEIVKDGKDLEFQSEEAALQSPGTACIKACGQGRLVQRLRLDRVSLIMDDKSSLL